MIVCGIIVLTVLHWVAQSMLFQAWSAGRYDCFDMVYRYGSQDIIQTAGMTKFADPASYYSNAKLSHEQVAEYFSNGATFLRNAIPAQTIKDLRAALQREFGHQNNMWSHMRVYDSNELHDFYVYSSIGSLTAQLFEATGAKSPSSYLWREFTYVRHPDTELSGWHFDMEDCDFPGIYATFTDTNRPRVWVPLDDDVEGPVIITQSMYASALSGNAKAQYLDPSLSHQINESEWHAGRRFWVNQYEAGNMTGFLQFPVAKAGDLIIHSGCLYHKSPLPAPTEKDFKWVLFPTYASGSSVYHDGHHMAFSRAMKCVPDNSSSDTVDAVSSCFLQAYPPAARPKRGTKSVVRRRGTVFDWVESSLTRAGSQSIPPDKGRENYSLPESSRGFIFDHWKTATVLES